MCGQDAEAKAIATDVAAWIRHRVGSMLLVVADPVHFVDDLREHLTGVVLGAVNAIAQILLPKKWIMLASERAQSM